MYRCPCVCTQTPAVLAVPCLFLCTDHFCWLRVLMCLPHPKNISVFCLAWSPKPACLCWLMQGTGSDTQRTRCSLGENCGCRRAAYTQALFPGGIVARSCQYGYPTHFTGAATFLFLKKCPGMLLTQLLCFPLLPKALKSQQPKLIFHFKKVA
jgi:hypothetical protein